MKTPLELLQVEPPIGRTIDEGARLLRSSRLASSIASFTITTWGARFLFSQLVHRDSPHGADQPARHALKAPSSAACQRCSSSIFAAGCRDHAGDNDSAYPRAGMQVTELELRTEYPPPSPDTSAGS